MYNMTGTVTNPRILSGNITYSFPQDFLPPTVGFPYRIELPQVLPFEDFFAKKTAESIMDKSFVISEDELLSTAKKYYEENKEILLKKYKGKYIAILNNKVVGSDKDFSKLAQKVYKKYGYQTIYMPFVDTKEKIVRIPSPTIKTL